MGKLVWHEAKRRKVETGVSKAVVYPNGGDGVAWTGITAVSSTPEGAEDTKLYADNKIYANLKSPENFSGSIEAYTSPQEFGICDGSYSLVPGLNLGQQSRKPFHFCYRTEIYKINSKEEAYKIHLIYNATTAPSNKQFSSKSDSPDPVKFSWEFKTVPTKVDDYKPFSEIILDSTAIDPINLKELESIIYGTQDGTPYMPTPDAVLNIVNMNRVTRMIVDVLSTHKHWNWDEFVFSTDTVPKAIERESLKHVFKNPAPETEYIQPSVAFSLISADRNSQKFAITVIDNKAVSELASDLETALNLVPTGTEVVEEYTYYHFELTL